ncbi:MAG: ABC transporter substrate-binding protein [Meiothermus sp.]|uniref:ABC transporter substrate-binding protein n=1 Tax=Meiothermus sp. TaxID=1955249 RepID=UPI00298F3133|nr:ABC transporter substrate-binding protein [Meiothermus sp.]MCX7601793.1 ABC transporter substrate-binding protein [Meiothermus sp.]MDW8425613.1 ABC transporter substrate-binding protein [Meiothermus sp.]
MWSRGFLILLWMFLGMAAAQQRTNVRFTLDFAFQGPTAPFLVAQDKGYYTAEGLNVSIDRGFGSADAISKVAAGNYDMGFADFNSLIEFNTRNPNNQLLAVFMVYNTTPAAVFSLKGKGISKPADLVGKTLAAPAGDAGRRLFPVFAEAVGIDASKVNFINVDVPLREPTLARGQADGITGFYFTSFLNLRNVGVKPEDMVIFKYGDFTQDLYGNAVVVRRDFAQANPQAVSAFLRALVKGFKDVIANPDEGIAAVKRRDGLINEALERERLLLALNSHVLTADSRAFGLGSVRRERVERNIRAVAKAFELPTTLKVEQVWSERFLPPIADRRVTGPAR